MKNYNVRDRAPVTKISQNREALTPFLVKPGRSDRPYDETLDAGAPGHSNQRRRPRKPRTGIGNKQLLRYSEIIHGSDPGVNVGT